MPPKRPLSIELKPLSIELKLAHTPPNDAASFLLTGVTLSDPVYFWMEGATKMQMTDTQQAVAHIGNALDSEGNPAKINSATWESSDTSIVTVTPAPDGMSAVIGSPSPAPLGSAVVTVTAISGKKTLSATLAVDIIGGDATSIEITTDEPTDT